MIFEIFPKLEFHHFTDAWTTQATTVFKKRYAKNTYSKYFQIIRQILIKAKKEKVFIQEIPQFEVSYEASKKAIYLPQEDVVRLYNHNYTNLYTRNAVNLWMVMYITACRVGDLKKVLKEKYLELQGSNYVRFMQGKTKNTISLPVTELLHSLREYSHHITSQHINEYIKIAAKEAGIKEYDKISCHTARRSIITNLVLDGMALKQVMDISGHKTEKELMKYIRYNDLTAAQKIKESPIYNNIINSLSIAN